ncbi:hypothetical protein PCASD_02978 [Puccinia coronata f. sp. avenae]|uniref:Uncharacterized protein n=1 Tax=Puccinia coronata f. sp. avenae TaxID=200324 RepID=A0A2N5VGV5_9BASI|nr:hypothetical protein PCASD_02978 [Puccinia coronata f. sp. avenae]
MRIHVGLMTWYFWMASNPSRADASSSNGREQQQQVLSYSEEAGWEKTDSNYNLIFSSFAGLLQQWPNTFAYSGHSIIPGIVPRATLLYHGTNDTNGPPKTGLEWLAFDSEMSYRIANIRPGNTSLYTYVASHPLRVIYFDGQSASLGTPGFMDSQYAIINGSVPEPFLGRDLADFLKDEYARAAALCKLAEKYGFEGVIRMNTGFELLCLDAKRRSDGTSAGPRSRHRLYGISEEDAKTVQGRLAEVLRRKGSENWRVEPGRPDWRAMVLTILDRYSPLLSELDYLLNRADLNATEQAIEVRTLTYDLIMPSLDFSDWNSAEPRWLFHGIRRCTRAYTSAPLVPSDLSPSTRMIIRAIEGTLEGLCGKIYDLFEQTIRLDLPITPSPPFNSSLESIAGSKIPEWREQVESLQKWLGWSTWAH